MVFNSFIKKYKWLTVSFLAGIFLAVAITGLRAVIQSSNVNSGDTLTSSLWNTLVADLTSLDNRANSLESSTSNLDSRLNTLQSQVTDLEDLVICPCGVCGAMRVRSCSCSCGGLEIYLQSCTTSGWSTVSGCGCTPCCSCFVAGTEIAMAGGAYKRIEDVEIGDQVLGHDGAINTVMKLERPLIDGRGTWFINNKVEVTGEHPFLTDSGWKVPDLELFYKQREAHGRYQDIEPRELEIGDVLILQNGAEAVESLAHSYDRPEDEIVYDLLVDGNHTYIADGFVVWDSN